VPCASAGEMFWWWRFEDGIGISGRAAYIETNVKFLVGLKVLGELLSGVMQMEKFRIAWKVVF